jgi:ABC-2 type transport system ATP-binding protein
MASLAIETSNLSKNFGSVNALDGLSIEVPSGSVFGFLGPNGAGKTTTIWLLLGLLEPNRGSGSVLGFDTVNQADQIRLHCGALLEHNGLYERLSAEDNLEFEGRVWRIPKTERQARIKALLTNLDLWERRKEPVVNWSRGMKQKLAMARALFHRPALLFLDEPTAGLDPSAAARLRDNLEQLVEMEGVTVFLNTHNLAEAERLCQQIGIIRNGKLIANGSPSQLRAQAGSPQLEVSGRGINSDVLQLLRDRTEVLSANHHNDHLTIKLRESAETSPLVSLLVNSGVQVDEVIKSQSSLEEVFLSLVNEDEASGNNHD